MGWHRSSVPARAARPTDYEFYVNPSRPRVRAASSLQSVVSEVGDLFMGEIVDFGVLAQWGPENAQCVRRCVMTAAVFALAGAVLGVLGTLAVEMARARAETSQSRRESVRSACADFTTAIAHLRNLAVELIKTPGETDLVNLMNQAHRESRAQYERLRLT